MLEHLFARTRTVLTSLLMVAAPLGCGEDDPTGAANSGPLSVEVLLQELPVALPHMEITVLVQVTDAEGMPVERPGIPVSWSVREGGGTIQATAAETDARGRVLANWTLGSELEVQAAEVRARDGEPTPFDIEVVEPGPISFRSDRSCTGGSQTQLFVSEPDGSNQIPIGECGVGWTTDWSPAGDLLAFVSDGSAGSQIWVTDPAGLSPLQLTNDVPPDARGLVMEAPVWSPDGSSIAFVIKKGVPECTRSDKNIYTMDPSGGSRSKVTLECGQGNETPSWSPDGTRLVFASNRFGLTNLPRRKLFVVDANGSNETQLTDGVDDGNPAWSPDGQQILFTRNGDLWLMNAAGSGAREIYASALVAWGKWSPDGTRVVITDSSETSAGAILADVLVLDLTTGETRDVSRSPGSFDCCADWRGN